MPKAAVLYCNGPSAAGFPAPEGAFVLALNDGFRRRRADAVLSTDCEVPAAAWLGFPGRRIQAAHNPTYPTPDPKRDQLFECREVVRKYRSSAAAALAWLAAEGFPRVTVAGMDALLGGGQPGAKYTPQGHAAMLLEFAPRFPEGLYLALPGGEQRVTAEMLAALPEAPAGDGSRASAAPGPAAPGPGAKAPARPAADYPLIVAYYTAGTAYAEEAKVLRLSLEALDLDHEITPVPNLGTWQKNTQHKAVFLRERLAAHPGRPLLYLDVDAILIRRPDELCGLACDFAAVRFAGRSECQSGTVYLGNTPKCRELVDNWVALNEKYPEKLPNGREAWDQRTLQMAADTTPGLLCLDLPPEYCWITGFTARQLPGINPVVVHTRGAYRLKEQIDSRPGDPVPWAAFPSVSVQRAAKCARLWQDLGYKVAVLIEQPRATLAETRAIGADKVLRPKKWTGFPAAANALLRACPGPVVVLIGDDILPHPQEPGPVLARRFLEAFPDTFGVMQPTGDAFGGYRTACISPWIGRAFIQKAYGGKGPYWGEYFHYFSDQELQEVAVKLGCFRQERGIFQFHDHWQRRGEERPEHLLKAKARWESDRETFKRRQAAGFPGCEVKTESGAVSGGRG